MTYQEFKVLKVGDTLTITDYPCFWSSELDSQKGLEVVEYPYTLIIDSIKSVDSHEIIFIRDANEFGWAINRDTLKFFKIGNDRKSRIENLNI